MNYHFNAGKIISLLSKEDERQQIYLLSCAPCTSIFVPETEFAVGGIVRQEGYSDQSDAQRIACLGTDPIILDICKKEFLTLCGNETEQELNLWHLSVKIEDGEIEGISLSKAI